MIEDVTGLDVSLWGWPDWVFEGDWAGGSEGEGDAEPGVGDAWPIDVPIFVDFEFECKNPGIAGVILSEVCGC